MTDHKITDAEIVKALECCMIKTPPYKCEECPLLRGVANSCIYECKELACALIKRQKAELDTLRNDTIPKLENALERANYYGLKADEEVEHLKAEIERLQAILDCYEETSGNKQAKAEAIKEFAENLTQDIKSHRLEMNMNGLKGTHRTDEMTYETIIEYIDNLVKEMTEGNNE